MCICLCFDVSKSELKKAIRDGHDSIEKLSEHIQVGSHCGGCIGRIEEILEKKKNRGFLWPLRTTL
ncbi:MAG: (2Fe-2S)-binding protein [Methylobacter sp.]